jgi:hypothetical protein
MAEELVKGVKCPECESKVYKDDGFWFCIGDSCWWHKEEYDSDKH